MTYWATVFKRAARETLALTPWASPAKAVFSVIPTLVAAVAAYALTSSPVQTGLITLAVTLALATSAFVWKMATVPPAMAREAEQALAALTPSEDAKAAAEKRRRRGVIDDLVRLYPLVADSMPPEIAAGIELPPMEWLNEELARRDEDWQIIETRGREYWTLEVRAMTPEEKITVAARSGQSAL
ncbi:hypothetical protein [Brevundimonas sp. A19_0]|uniref:hypothetical protein n=1 Tax=Brevundimonas sp. A19_0 TaxID=2821087 RepID=UPI001AD99684|nr:hypothetical protein [Brevundimonas sp. A19_0]MBO9501650.1 hypothetical protein [Brevundimonas sp. A19_0]